MANPSADRTNPRDTRTGAAVSPETAVPLGAMQEPLGSMERPVPNSTESVDGPGFRDPSLRETSVPASTGRGFTTTFALAAVVLLVAFMVALYLGSNGSDVTNTATDTTAPITETAPVVPGNGDSTDTTGSTTVAPDGAGTTTPPVVEPQPGTGTTGTTNP